MKKIILGIIIIFTLTFTAYVSAQGLLDAQNNLDKIGGTQGEKLGVPGDLPGAIGRVVRAILSVVGTIFLILTIYAGILWMTAQGEEEKAKKARDIISMAVIGLVIVMSAYAITYFVTSSLTKLR